MKRLILVKTFLVLSLLAISTLECANKHKPIGQHSSIPKIDDLRQLNDSLLIEYQNKLIREYELVRKN